MRNDDTPPEKKQARKQKRKPRDGFVVTKQTMDTLLRQKDHDDMIVLYNFLNYTALWQGTNQPRATVSFIAKGLHWGLNKVRRVKKRLAELGMIEDLCLTDPQSKKVTGWYVRVSYFRSTLTDGGEGGKRKPPSRKNHSVDSRQVNASDLVPKKALRLTRPHTRTCARAPLRSARGGF